MVHRPADSRLLTNLLSHERDYSKHLFHLLEHSQVSLASFSAYAAASSPQLSHAIIAVAGSLAGADDALRKYAASLEAWQSHLKALKDLEDEVGNIVRDREILVTRLLKASKQQKPSRDSLIASSGSTSSLSFVKPEISIGPKLSAAQTELQACEAHLAMKERQLESLRTTAIQSGLYARCKAMVECGWAWGEMGKEGLRVLEIIGSEAEPQNSNGTHPYTMSPQLKPFPGSGNHSDSGHAHSDLSSIAPSQSASQITLPVSASDGTDHNNTEAWRMNTASAPVQFPNYTLDIPPAHAVSEHIALNGGPRAHWRISEVEEPDEEGGGSSAEEEDETRPVEMHENERFGTKGKWRGKAPASGAAEAPKTFSIRARTGSVDSGPRHVRFPTAPSLADPPSSQSSKKERHRSGSGSFFQRGIAALFHKDKGKHEAATEGRTSPTASRSGSRWHTRTDKHLARTRRGGDSSDDEGGAHSQQISTWSPAFTRSTDTQSSRANSLVPSMSISASASSASATQRLKKRTKRNSTQARPVTRTETEANKGWVSDSAMTPFGDLKGKKKAAERQRSDQSVETIKAATRNADVSNAAKNSSAASTSTRSSNMTLPSSLSGHTSLSRNSSLSRQSAASTPTQPLMRSPTSVSASSSQQQTTPPAHRRTASIEISDPASKPSPPPPAKGHKRGNSVSSPHRSGLTRDTDVPSLMSIVEGVAKENRQAWAKQDPNRLLVLPKAPPPVNASVDTEDVHKLPASAGAGPSTQSMVGVSRSPSRNHVQMSASASAPTLPLSTSRPFAKTPLRSALRNSRTPSPNPPVPSGPPPIDPVVDAGAGPSRHGLHSLAYVTTRGDVADTASISSYETGHENFAEESDSMAAPPPPPHDEKPLTTSGSDMSNSTASTAGPARRKSVRMSLPPTFSATPPAIDDDEDARGRHHPWSPSTKAPTVGPGGWTSRHERRGTGDLWVDSSDDDDEEYRTAKHLLSRVTKGTRS